MVMIGAPRQFAFIPAAFPLAPVAAPVVTAGATATVAAGASAVAIAGQVAAIAVAGALSTYLAFVRGLRLNPWGAANTKWWGSPDLPPGIFTDWPGEGTWDPVGVNEWGWGITDGDAWDDSCRVIKVMENVGTRTAPGEVAWLKLGGSYPRCGGTAHRDAVVWVGPVVGNEAQGRPVATYRLNGISVTAKIKPVVQPLSGPGTGQPLPQPGVLPPSGATDPRFDPLPALPLPVPGFAPKPRPPQTLPSTEPSPVPVAPGVVAPPMVGTGTPPKALPPVPATATPTGPDGRPILKPGPGPITTPADVHFPGGVPVPSNPPQPTLQGIAAEVGRIENKLARLFAPPGGDGFDWAEKLREVWDIINSRYEAGYYDLWAPCDKGPTGEFLHEKFEWDAGFSEFGSLRVRLDAIAQMLQRQKDWKQPICEPEIPANNGRAINVQFRSTVASPNGEKPLRKVFGYRDPSGKELIEHRDHWVGFEFESGPWQVKSKGAVWGQVQVWATSEAEGRRVIEHAAAIAGVNLQGHEHRWIAREVMDPRYGVRLRMSVRRDTQGAIWVTERTGPNGLPVVAVPLAPGPGVGP